MSDVTRSAPAARLTRLWRAFSYRGDDTLSPRHSRAVLLLASFAPISAVAFWGYAAFYMAYDHQNLWPAALVCLLAGAGFLVLPAIIRRGVFLGSIALLILGGATFATLCYLFSAKSGLNLGFLTGTILALLILGTARPARLAIIAGPAVVLALVLPWIFPNPALSGVTPALIDMIYQSNVLALLTLTGVALFFAVRQVEIAETALAAEHDRSETLLANLLPAEIAARLKATPKGIIADDIPQVSILFADIVDFTPRASRMRPENLVQFLNRVFSAFDALTAKHGLEKIKTIGDAYMVAAGMPLPRRDHAHIIAEMSLDMIAATQRLSAEMGETVEVRIGLHSGPAIAGVIGTTKVFYDVWGDTVNTASRLESHGVAGRIQVTTETRALLGSDYAFEERGPVDLKGKGMTQVWWLSGRSVPPAPPS